MADKSVEIATRKAGRPFNKDSADLILRSSDGVDFLVRKAVLEEASSVFSDMFVVGCSRADADAASTAPATTRPSKLPVVDLSENSAVLDNLLRLIYPTKNPVFTNMSDVLDVHAAASKYMLGTDINDDILTQLDTLAEPEPLLAYAMACVLHREDAMRRAAKAALLRPCPGRDAYCDALESITAGDFIRLQNYHEACKAAVVRAVCSPQRDWKGRKWQGRTHGPAFGPTPPGKARAGPRVWWTEWLAKARVVLEQTPHPKAVSGSHALLGSLFASGVIAASESHDQDAVIADLSLFVEEYTNAIEAAVNTVKLEIKWK